MVNGSSNLKLRVIVFIITLLAILYSTEALPLSDAIIKQRIEAKVSDTPQLVGTPVRVDVEDGLVVLSGTVQLYAQKMTYESIAWYTMGVAAVEDEIRVIPLFHTADTVIKRQIEEIMETYRQFHSVGLTVAVAGGAVELHGTFNRPRDVLFLKQKVAEIEGVIAIALRANFAA